MKQHPQERFDEAFKLWARRPPRIPADEARRRVLARLAGRDGGWMLSSRGLRFAAAAMALSLLLIAGWVMLGGPRTPPATGELILPPLPEDVVLLWLDDRTPLYLTVAPPAAKGES